MALPPIKNQYLQDYLEYVENSESPRLFHVWTAMSIISTCLGRRCYIPFGPVDVYPNQFILIVGPPAAKKSTAVKVGYKLLKAYTGVRFAPDDTGGARQGLIAAMENLQENVDSENLDNALSQIGLGDTAALGKLEINLHTADRHHLYISANEFGSIIGTRDNAIFNFLTKMWDGDPYNYRLKNENCVLENALLNLIAATTPAGIATHVPPSAVDSGYLSRFVLVFANVRYKAVPIPQALDDRIALKLKETLHWAYYDANGVFNFSDAARNMIVSLYDVETTISDTRFTYYTQRRQSHLLKLSMSLAASRRSQIIEKSDVEEAHMLLTYTERGMTEALGEFGSNPISNAKQSMIEYIRNQSSAVAEDKLFAIMQKDLRRVDFLNAVQDLVSNGKLIKMQSKNGSVYMPGSGLSSEDSETVIEMNRGQHDGD